MVVARKFVAGLAELASLGLFLGMIWLWAAAFSVPATSALGAAFAGLGPAVAVLGAMARASAATATPDTAPT